MKLDIYKPNVESFGALEEQQFSVGDAGMILDILRSKMYSNPILAICREISCNARDAHREVGTPDRPIHIHLPNNLEPYYKIKDWGPGMSPERIYDVYVRYGISTKRENNIQTGAFGIGSKTPWAYSDTFSVVTNYNGIQYNYACFIDETRVGKLSLQSQSPTKEPNGTEIMIPVQPKNFHDFANWTEQACRHWDVKPVIKGNQITYQEMNPILQGKNWSVSLLKQYWGRGIKLIIDGIEYPLELDALRKYGDASIFDCARGHLVLYFGVGELSLSASREQVYLDEKTQGIICDRIQTIKDEVKEQVVKKIESLPNLWQACIFYRGELRDAFSSLDFLGPLHWQGIRLEKEHQKVPVTVFHFNKGHYKDPDKLSRSCKSYLSFESGSELYINDLPIQEPAPRHVKKAWDTNPNINSVQVICPTSTMTEAELNKLFHLDSMAPKRLSSITKATARTYTPASTRLVLFKLVPSVGFKQDSYASLEEDKNVKVLCTISKDNAPAYRQVILKSGKNLSCQAMQYIANKFPSVSFYGVDAALSSQRRKADFAECQEMEKFLTENVLTMSKSEYLKRKFALDNYYHVDTRALQYFDTFEKHLSPSSTYLKRLRLHKKISQLAAGESKHLLLIYEAMHGDIDATALAKFLTDNPKWDIDSIDAKCTELYPLLKHVTSYYHQDISQDLAQYINLVDQSQEKA